jgi:hypothetical protein
MDWGDFGSSLFEAICPRRERVCDLHLSEDKPLGTDSGDVGSSAFGLFCLQRERVR